MTERGTFRPGGLELTEVLLDYGGFSPGDKVVDIGCGEGATVELLRREYALDAVGIDTHPPKDETPYLLKGTAYCLPFEDGSLDNILFECSFSLLEEPEKALDQCRRVLRPGGRLLLSDLYSRGEDAPLLSGEARYLYTREALVQLLRRCGFRVDVFADCSGALKAMVAQMIMDGGAEALYRSVGSSREEMRRARCGYCLVVAEKE